MPMQKITIHELLAMYNKNKNNKYGCSYLCFMLEGELIFKLRGATIQYHLSNFFEKYFRFAKDSENSNTLPLWVTHWVSDFNPEDNIVGHLFPIDGEPITIYQGEGVKIREWVMEHIAKVDPGAYVCFPQRD